MFNFSCISLFSNYCNLLIFVHFYVSILSTSKASVASSYILISYIYAFDHILHSFINNDDDLVLKNYLSVKFFHSVNGELIMVFF